MLESRGLTQECVSRGEQSAGFREFSGLAPGLAPLPDHGYRIYLECLFDEIGREVPALFDRRDEASLLWPRRQALNELLDTLNAREIAGVWAEDETIGWVYQYFNSLEERRKMRDESTAPRNSYELAVRNQFFTPRYVIQFLTDNTLGRTWYEMRKGDTALSGRCQYLVRRPKEVFLSDPWKAAEFLWGSEDGQRRGVLPPSVAAAFKGQLSGIECDDGHLARWISLAIHPEQFAKITGEPYNSYDFSVLDQIWDSLEKDEDAPVLHDSLSIWMALCNFTINDGGGAYSIKPFRTLWELFLRAIQEEQEKMREASQAELANQPVYVPHRQKKDPRDLKVLDPACGSGHFLLYCFDLFQTIYEEAYNDEELGPALRHDYPDFELFRRAVPALILRHNLHGIDIDARCDQIAELALWMRAQRAYREMGLKPNERPAINQINIVCAEPMPGEQDLLKEFIAALPDDAPGELVRGVFERMTLAGEAGSLLRIEDDIREPIARAKEEWERARGLKQPELFDKSAQSSLFGRASINDEKFWDMAEQRVLDALRDYARHASLSLINGHSFQRRLFAEDALQGFDFIDLLRLKFDVVLMNPPFGDASLQSKKYIDETYGDTRGDVYKAFVECCQDRLTPGGMLGLISSRTGFFLGQSADWRERVVLRLYRPLVLLDLGMGVLDAMVETAAYVLRSLTKEEDRELTISLVPELSRVPVDKNDCFSTKKYETLRDLKRHQANQELQRLQAAGFIKPVPGSFPRWSPQHGVMEQAQVPPSASYPSLVCLRLLGEAHKANALQEVMTDARDSRRFVVSPEDFRQIPNVPFAYWVSNRVRRLFTKLIQLENGDTIVRQGGVTGDDIRHLRAWWEVLSLNGDGDYAWIPFAKGGESVAFFNDQILVVGWDFKRGTFKGFTGLPHRPSLAPANASLFFRPGLTWSRRTNGLSFRILPSGCIFADKGPAIFVANNSTSLLLALCSLLNSQPFRLLVSIQIARIELAQSYEVGLVQQTPIPDLDGTNIRTLATTAQRAWTFKRTVSTATERSQAFISPALLQLDNDTLSGRIARWLSQIDKSEMQLVVLQREIDDTAFRLYGISNEDRKSIEQYNGNTQTTLGSEDEDTDEEDAEQPSIDHYKLIADLLSYALGSAFGRWDVRYATGEKEPPPLPDPFAPLPVCAPGALQGDDGLPLTSPDQLPEGYPLANIAWDGVLVDDPGHPKDLLAAARAVFEVIWPEKADDIWRESAALLEAPGGDLRAWFRRRFFEGHKKRYSKSRRKAPIYWQLATPSGSYSIWLYYHRFSKDTFYSVLRHVKDKLDHEESKLAGLRSAADDALSRSQRREIDEQESFVAELRSLREEVERIAPLWNPNLNDGVIINFAPLWRLVPQHRAWQKELRDCWEKLTDGEYDWAHLAMHLWPERVVPKCQTDASLAIAHGLEEVFWRQDEKGKWRRKEVDDATVKSLVTERASPAVKAALKSLLEAPTAQGRSARQRTTPAEPQLAEDSVKTKRRKRAAKPKAEQTPTEGGMFEAEA